MPLDIAGRGETRGQSLRLLLFTLTCSKQRCALEYLLQGPQLKKTIMTQIEWVDLIAIEGTKKVYPM